MNDLPVGPERRRELEAMALEYGPAQSPIEQADPDCMDGVQRSAQLSMLYDQDHDGEDALRLAAYFLQKSVTMKQCYTDGQKRMSWLIAMEILASAHYDVSASPEEAAEFVLRVTTERTGVADVAAWLGERLIGLPDPVGEE